MKIKEIVQEAHHSIVKVLQMGPWRVHIDTHAVASQAARRIDPADFTNIVSFAVHSPNTVSTIPVGKGAYFQDVNTRISIYIKRLSNNELRVETVLSPDMKPTPPLFRRSVPPHNLPKLSKKIASNQDNLARQADIHGRDHVSQQLATIAPIVNMNRADRRALSRLLNKKK